MISLNPINLFRSNSQPKVIYVRERKKKKSLKQNMRGFDSARFDRLTADFLSQSASLNKEIGSDLTAMRNRSRSLYKSNDYYKRCIDLYVNYVIGPKGITLVNRAKISEGKDIGKDDKNANDKIEYGFNEFGRKKYFTLNSADSFKGSQDNLARCKARDGETFTRIHRFTKNKFGVCFSFIDPEFLDVNYNNDALTNGRFISQGIEFDSMNRVVAYHFNDPKDMNKSASFYPNTGGKKIIIPADEIIHDFNKIEPNQIRGFPIFQGIMIALFSLSKLNESEMVNFRYSSCKMATIERDYPDENQIGEFSGASDDLQGRTIDQLEPGEVSYLNAGEHLNFTSPDHKTGNYDLFQKCILRSVSSGSGFPYCLIANDYTGMSEDSIRLQRNDVLDFAMQEQSKFIENWGEKIYDEFIKFSLTKQAVNLPFSKLEQFSAHEFRGRAFQPLRPLEEAQANKINWENAGNSRTNYHRSLNQDTYDIFTELGNEEELSRQFKISIRNQGGTAADNVGQPGGGNANA